MKTCYNCKGKVKKISGPVKLSGIVIEDIIYEECQQCHEQYFDTKTSVFIQSVINFVQEKRRILNLELVEQEA